MLAGGRYSILLKGLNTGYPKTATIDELTAGRCAGACYGSGRVNCVSDGEGSGKNLTFLPSHVLFQISLQIDCEAGSSTHEDV